MLPSLTGAKSADKVIVSECSAPLTASPVMSSPAKMDEIATMPGVNRLNVYSRNSPPLSSDIDFVGTRSFWTKSRAGFVGMHGENVSVAIIDSGIDYVHTNFGGPGTAAAYAACEDKDPVPNPDFPNQKVQGGFDFAGDNYHAIGTPAEQIPALIRTRWTRTVTAVVAQVPAAGYGVNFGGFTYFGSYDNSTNINGMKIAPGYAPQSKLYALRVFGTSGSSSLISQAIDWAMDPNGDGDFSDKMDVINMSRLSKTSRDTQMMKLRSLRRDAAAAGIVVVASAGNSGDTYYNTGSPGVASGILSVAATFNDQAGYIYDASVLANSLAAIAGMSFFALHGNTSPRPAGGTTGDVVEARPRVGSNTPSGAPYDATPLTNAAFMVGKICLVDRGVSSFYQKSITCQNSGAIGVIIVNETQPGADPITPGLTPAAGGPPVTIPVVMITKADGDTIRAAAAFNATTGVPANPTNVTIRNDNGVVQRPGTATDTLPLYSARGPRSFDSALKPDLAAPAEVVGIALKQTGNGVANFNGTSSAAPHVAGMMALLRQQHPDWSVQELNAAAVNTATNDLFNSSPSASPVPSPNPQVGPGRIGGGRINGTKASNVNVVAYNGSDNRQQGVSFGSVEVPVDGSVALTKMIRVVNKGTASVTYNLTYQDVVPTPGTSYTFPNGGSVTVPAGGTVDVPVLFSATGSALRHTRESSVAATQAVSGGTLGRHWLTERAGYAVFTPTGGSEPFIRVALYAAPKPAAAMRSSISGFVPPAPAGSFSVPLTGAGISNGNATPTDIISLGKLFELQYAHPLVGSPVAPVDQNVIKHVGVTSDYANPTPAASPAAAKSNTMVVFGVDAFGNSSAPAFQFSDKEIVVDTNRDGTDDYLIYLDSRPRADNVTGRSNAYYPVVLNLSTGAGFYQGVRTNIFNPTALDTNTMNNSAAVIPIPATSLGLIGTNGTGPTKFNYYVVTFNRNGELIDETPVMNYDLANPGFELSGGGPEPFMELDLPGENLPVSYNGTNYQALGSRGLLMIHMHNATGFRSSRSPSASRPSGDLAPQVVLWERVFRSTEPTSIRARSSPSHEVWWLRR